ncbi:MAG: hypothetical protein HRT72_08620 [Flavobacteriales bacterium]|nr:hypothetical protein [Flavobacteriales bacterium]
MGVGIGIANDILRQPESDLGFRQTYSTNADFVSDFTMFVPMSDHVFIRLGANSTKFSYAINYDYSTADYAYDRELIEEKIKLLDIPLGIQYRLYPSPDVVVGVSLEAGISARETIYSESSRFLQDTLLVEKFDRTQNTAIKGVFWGAELSAAFRIAGNVSFLLATRYRSYPNAIGGDLWFDETTPDLSSAQFSIGLNFAFKNRVSENLKNKTSFLSENESFASSSDSSKSNFDFWYRNTLQLDFMPYETLFLLSCERIIINGSKFKLGIKAGVGYGNESPIMPFGLNFMWSHGNIHFELNSQYVYFLRDSGKLNLMPQVGVRYQKPSGRLLVKAYISPFVVEHYKIISPYSNRLEILGVTVGYSFWQ